MAAIYPRHQMYVDITDGLTIGIHVLWLTSASDSITVPQLASTTASAASAQLRTLTDASATVTDDGDDVVTIVGTKNRRCIVVTLHATRINSGPEA